MLVFVFGYIFHIWEGFSSSPEWPWIRIPPASVSWVLALQECTTTPHSNYSFFNNWAANLQILGCRVLLPVSVKLLLIWLPGYNLPRQRWLTLRTLEHPLVPFVALPCLGFSHLTSGLIKGNKGYVGMELSLVCTLKTTNITFFQLHLFLRLLSLALSVLHWVATLQPVGTCQRAPYWAWATHDLSIQQGPGSMNWEPWGNPPTTTMGAPDHSSGTIFTGLLHGLLWKQWLCTHHLHWAFS
jgi:hypothetical protein